LANVSPEARLGVGVSIGAFASVEADVELGDHCVVASGAGVKSGVKAGSHNEFCEHAVIGGAPQHAGRPQHIGRVAIGEGNVFREYVTIHRALKPETATTVGNGNYVMASGHFGHDCTVGNNAIFANGAMLGGHVSVSDRAFVSGAVAVHQFCRVGRLAMVGGHARVVQDVPPFMLCEGLPARPRCVNVVALRRGGFSRESIAAVTEAHRLLYRAKVGLDRAREILGSQAMLLPEVVQVLEFLAMQQEGRHGRARERRRAA
jgi:UDP-N-acetylglucosamine acyltransferase